jgi:hypothetical protein
MAGLRARPARAGGALAAIWQPSLLHIAVPVLVVLQLCTAQAAHVFDTYRLLQFDRQGAQFGSRRAAMNQLATVVEASAADAGDRSAAAVDEREPVDASSSGSGGGGAEDADEFVGDEAEAGSGARDAEAPRSGSRPRPAGKGDLVRNVVLVMLKDVTVGLLDDVVDARRAAGVLIILPRNLSAVTADQARRLHATERHLLQREFHTPIYFCFEDDEIAGVVDSLTAGNMGGDRYQVVVAVSEATATSSATLSNFQVRPVCPGPPRAC